jgi:hypothetical protein
MHIEDGCADGWQHWGIPYTFDVEYFGLHNVKFFAQDYLNAIHSTAAINNAITISTVTMLHRELTMRQRNVPGRRGCVSILL